MNYDKEKAELTRREDRMYPGPIDIMIKMLETMEILELRIKKLEEEKGGEEPEAQP
jgi:hypothetical protein